MGGELLRGISKSWIYLVRLWHDVWIKVVFLPCYSRTKLQLSLARQKHDVWTGPHSPIDNCGLFIWHEEYKSQLTSYKYRLCSYSLQQSRRQYSFFSRSAKSAGGFKQLHNKQPSARFFLAVLLCKILESRWVFKSVHRYNVLSFHSSSPGESVRTLTVLIDVWRE